MNTKLTILALLALFLISCGGGGGSSSSSNDDNNNNNRTTPPQLTQVATQTLVVGSAANITITNTGGELNQCTIDPDLPNNLNLAVSNNNCQITGIAVTQTATVTYTITAINNAGESTSNLSLVVKAEGTIVTDIPITSININGTSTITAGDTTQLITTITPSNATNQNLIWSSNNEEVATVNTGGLVTAINPGEATITTAATDGSGITANINITVTPIYITSISISGTNTITVGNTTQLTTVVTPNDASNQNLTWSSSNNNIATVNNTGLVTALRVGTATITATATDSSGVSADFVISVSADDIAITQIELRGANTIIVGSATTLSATITPNDATNQNLNWSSSDETVATVNNTGLVTALNVGTATITATATDSSGVSGDFVISVVSELVPVVTNFTAELLIDAVSVGDTIGTITITNSPTTVTILADPNGYDQHFNINASGRLTIAQQLLTITYTLEVQATNDFGTTIGNLTITVSEIKELAKLIANDSAINNSFGNSVAIYNDYMLIGAPGNFSSDIPGYAYLFRVNETAGEVTQLAKLIAADGASYDGFGTAVALNNNYALIGAHEHNLSGLTDQGAAYLFDITNITPNTTITHTTKLVANDGGARDYFGTSVALNNNYALIGATEHDHSGLDYNGAAYLFDITNIVPNTTITHTTKLVANDGSDDRFGISVALNNNYALIGAYLHDHNNLSNNGAAYLFDITNITPNTTITHTTKLVANDGGARDRFGISVALNNNYALIGATEHDHSGLSKNGAAYLFDITGITPNTIITHTTKLVANDGGDDDEFGRSVALNNNYALIGADSHDHSNLTNNGAAYLFDITGITPNTIITHTTKLVANDDRDGDNFGRSVALNNNYALIGAYEHDHSFFEDGAAYIFGTSEALTIPVYNINITGTATITVNTTVQLNATVTPNNATNQNLNWSSSNEAVATVDNNGLVTALTPGEVTITTAATDGSGITRRTNIAVEPIYAITSISIGGANTIFVGKKTQLTTVVTPNNATNQNLNWSSSNEEVATVNTGGVVTALTVGTATITATATDGSSVTASINITVELRYITSISISGANTIAVDRIARLTATITPNDATNQNLNWSSSNEEIATVNNNGLVAALSTGEVTITATATDGSGVSGEFVISVFNELAPIVTDFTTELFINAINIGDTIGTITITNSPTIVTILDDPNGYDQHFNINESGRLTVAQQLLTITYTLQVQATNDFGTAIGSLTITVYEINELAKLIAHDSTSENQFGSSVAIYNDYMLIGAPGSNEDIANIPGYAYLFRVNETTREVTQLAKLLAADGRNDDQFGRSVALNDNYALVGAFNNDHSNFTNNGAAYLFDITNIVPNTTITHTTKLVANDGGLDDNFGISVALNNNYALIGAYQHDHSILADNGAAYVFDITNIVPNTTITHTTKLIANDGSDYDNFGTAVALNDNYALIGAYFHSHSNFFNNGAAYLFDITNITPNTTINHTTKLIANDGRIGDYFGISVALNNNYALIGAYQNDHSNLDEDYNDGAAYLFDITAITPNTTITHTTKLIANDGESDDNFGISVALNNNYALIGAYNHDHSNLSDNGAAYLFDITDTPNTTITHITKLIANDGSADDNFGLSVALNNNYALIGAEYHDHSNLTNNGAAYIFDLN